MAMLLLLLMCLMQTNVFMVSFAAFPSPFVGGGVFIILIFITCNNITMIVRKE